ncbi:MAG: GNAT family N-acetyltransferase [Armatimonadetes bacterium]|nr:GNAT family N-acetyltransferase [Armatimonadota bacterium]
MEFRQGSEGEAQQIADCIASGWRAGYQGILPAEVLDNLDTAKWAENIARRIGEGREYWVACEGDAIVGMASVLMEGTEQTLGSLYVRGEFQALGVGRMLVGVIARALAARSDEPLWVSVMTANTRGRAFYEKLGAIWVRSGSYPISGVDYSTERFCWRDLNALGDRTPLWKLEQWAPNSVDLCELTKLLHRAYKRSKDAGLRYNATHQSVETTERRLMGGDSYIVRLQDGTVIGCATLDRAPDNPYGDYQLTQPTAGLTQFCIEPKLKGREIGKYVVRNLERIAREQGYKVMALDTAEESTGLISYYRKLGFEVVGHVDYRPGTNYLSVVMAKSISQA